MDKERRWAEVHDRLRGLSRKEIERRAGHVARVTAPGSQWADVRRKAQASLREWVPSLSADDVLEWMLWQYADALLAVGRHGREEVALMLAADLARAESRMDALLDATLPDPLTRLLRQWRDASAKIRLEAESMGCDGCWYLCRWDDDPDLGRLMRKCPESVPWEDVDHALDAVEKAKSDTETLPQADRTGHQTEPAYSMKLDGEHWHIAFGEERGFVNKSRGAEHVAQLLASPGKAVACTELHGSTEGTLNMHQPTISRDDAKAQLKELRAQLHELEERRKGDPTTFTSEEAAELEKVKERICSLAHTVKRKERAPAARSAVSQCIERFKIACNATTLKDFAKHLDANLDTGAEPVYNGPHEWEIKK